MSKYEEKRQLKCSFCGKTQDQVRRLIAGPNVYICDECVELCDEIIQEEIEETLEEDTTSLPKPKEAATLATEKPCPASPAAVTSIDFLYVAS